jgi:Glutathionylspermidine synthase preATP-grasp
LAAPYTDQMSALPPAFSCRPADWRCPGPLPPRDFARLRRRLVLDHFKWDPQVGDVETLARFPLVLPAATARGLATLAEALAAETELVERELLERPHLLRRLGLPRRVRSALADRLADPPPAAARVIRFDFHPTADGWRISEANSDVPGGYEESSHFPRLMAEQWAGYRPAGDPAAAIAAAIHANSGGSGRVGFLAAPGYAEDQQVVACLAAELRRHGWATVHGRPGQIEWESGRARLRSVPLDAIIRFFQAEWLARVREPARWGPLFRGSRTRVCNPGPAILAESKRFPLVWDELTTPLPTWRALLPETRDPRTADWGRDPDWLLKAAFGNTGDAVIDRTALPPRIWRRTAWEARLWPGSWAAQRRFAILPVETPAGPMYPCLGVYTVDGRAAGIYGRLSPKPLIDFAAVDVAVLVRDDAPGGSP